MSSDITAKPKGAKQSKSTTRPQQGLVEDGGKNKSSKGKRKIGNEPNVGTIRAKAEDDEISHSKSAKRRRVEDAIFPAGTPQFLDDRQQKAIGLESKKKHAFRGFGTLQLIDGHVRLVFGYHHWNGREVDVVEAEILYKNFIDRGVLWMVWPMNIIAGPDEIDFESLTKEITEAPFHEVKLLELAISQGRLDSVAGQHRKAALEILHREWDKQIKRLEGLIDSAKMEGNADVSSLETEAGAMRKKKATNGKWVIAVWDRDLVDDELGLELASNEVQHTYKPSELEIVNGQLFHVVHATSAKGIAEAKAMLLINCRKLRICSLLNCPEFLDFMVEMYAIPGLRNCALFNDPAWLKSFLPVGTKPGKYSIVTGTLIHMFLVMLRSMVDIATEFVVGGSRSVQAVPDIWNTFLLTRADQIYKKTIGPVVSQDGESTETFIQAWRAYRLQIAGLLRSVFGEESMILNTSTSFNRASAWMYSNTLRLLPEDISESRLPWPILTNSVMRDFTTLFTKVQDGISLYVHIVEGHWGNPIDMDPHHKERFFDGTVVIHRHLDRLLAGMEDTDRMRARTELANHLRLKRSIGLARLQFLAVDNKLPPLIEPSDSDMEFSIRWNKAKDDLTTICSRERDVDDVVKILPNDSITSAEIAAITSSIHTIRPAALRHKEKQVVSRTKGIIQNTMRVVTRTSQLLKSSTYCEERRWFITFLGSHSGGEVLPWDQLPLPSILTPEDNALITITKEGDRRQSVQKDIAKWQKAVDMIIKLPFAVDDNNVLLPSVHRGIIEIGKGLMANADKQRHDKLEPKVKYDGLLPGSEWPLDLSAVRIPTLPSLNGTHSANDNNIMEKQAIRQGKDKFFDVTDEENDSSIQEVYPNFASLTQETAHLSAVSVQVPDESLRMEDNGFYSDECTNRLLSTGGSVTELETNPIEDAHDSLHGTDEFENNGNARGEAEPLSTTPVSNLSGNAHCGISLVEEDVSMMSAGDIGADGFLGEEEFREMAEDLESNEPEMKWYRHAIDSIHGALVEKTPNTSCYQTMTVLTVEMACEFSKMPSLKPLRAPIQSIRGIIQSDREFVHYGSLFDHPAEIYASFRDPHHIDLVGALLRAANDFVNPSPMDVVDISSALHSNTATTAKVARMVLREFPPGITTNTQKSNCIFDLERCSTLLERLKQKDAPAVSSGSSSRPSTQHHSDSNSTERLGRRSQGHGSASRRAGLSPSLVKFSGEMAEDAARKARTETLKNKLVRGPRRP